MITSPAAPGKQLPFQIEHGGKAYDGNSDVKHDYGAAAMTDEQRWQLVKYTKSL